jgi:hypothetical protein
MLTRRSNIGKLDSKAPIYLHLFELGFALEPLEFQLMLKRFRTWQELKCHMQVNRSVCSSQHFS